MEITKKKIKLATIYRPLNNFFLNPVMEYLRMKYICPNQIPKGRMSMREIINKARLKITGIYGRMILSKTFTNRQLLNFALEEPAGV